MIVRKHAGEGQNWYLPARILFPDQFVAFNTVVYAGNDIHRLQDIDLRVYDLDSASPEIAVYTQNAIAADATGPLNSALVVDG